MKKRELNKIESWEMEELEKMFCKNGKFFSIQKDKFNNLKYTFIETKYVTLPAPQELKEWLKEKGFEI